MVSYSGPVDLVFKALADRTRRTVLDELLRHDGQTLGELTAHFDMTRVAVAKHLQVLADAGLLVARRQGREKLHYLNPVPIRQLHDRWITQYTETWAAGLVELKRDLEDTVEKVFEIYIATSPERLWRAITDPDVRARYSFGARVESTWAPGSPYALTAGAAGQLVEGENLEVEEPRRLVQSYRAVWDESVAAAGTSRVTWEIEPVGTDSCRLTVIHDQLPEDAQVQLYGGWPMILSGLKTWLETGLQLTTPGSLRYGSAA
jgi:uncharacterized protein YndB with AHSA1/START domain/biotin operon repressor